MREVTNATAASGLDFHYKRNNLFYTDTEQRKVFKMALTPESSTMKTLDYSIPGNTW